MRSNITMLAAVATLAGALAAPSAVRAQDHVNVTIVAPTLGSFPRLVAGSFDITNSDQLASSQSVGPGGQYVTKSTGANEPAKVQMTLAWGSEVPQLLQAMVSASAQSPIDHITCDFVHAGSSQPYYTIVVDHPLISNIDLVYDSASATATEQIKMQATEVDYLDGSTSTSASSGSASAAPRVPPRSAVPSLRLTASSVMIRQLAATSAMMMGGPPVIGFASFAPGSGNSSSHFAAEGTFPAWATGAMTSVDSLAVSFERAIITHKQTNSSGTTIATPLPGAMKAVTASFTKPVGSLSNDLQGAVSALKPVTTTFELADAPGRLTYTFQFTNGLVSSDHTSLSNGHATERVTATSVNGVVVKNLRSNVSAAVP